MHVFHPLPTTAHIRLPHHHPHRGSEERRETTVKHRMVEQALPTVHGEGFLSASGGMHGLQDFRAALFTCFFKSSTPII